MTTVEFEALSGTDLRSMEPHCRPDDVWNSALSHPIDYQDTLQQQPFNFEDDFNGQIAALPNAWPSDFEFLDVFDYSADAHASHGAHGFLPDVSQLPQSPKGFSFDLNESPLHENGSHDNFQGSAREDSPLQSHASGGTRVIDPLLFEGSSPEELVLPLQLLKMSFPSHLARDSLGDYVGNVSLANFFDLVNNLQLHYEIEDLLCQCFEMSARSIRERQMVRTGRGPGISNCSRALKASTERSRSYSDNRNDQMIIGMGGQVTHHLMWAVSKGIIKLRLTSKSDGPIAGLESGPQNMLRVSFMPTDQKRTTGIQINFQRTHDALLRTALSRRIKSINVVPKDSEVIQCVKRNDLRSLQLLFDKREASPLDVDPQGCSLLSASLLSCTFPKLFTQETNQFSSTLCTTVTPISTCCCWKVGQVLRIVIGQYSVPCFLIMSHNSQNG